MTTLVLKVTCILSSCVVQHAHALEVLSDKLTDGANALDVGSGSGYLTACFARMVNCEMLLHHLFTHSYDVTKQVRLRMSYLS